MKMNPLGRTGIKVSDLCLGTMTFGNQTSTKDSHTQIEIALDGGINFMDTAEMYPVNPVRSETIGHSEEVIGEWIAKSGRRDEWIVATKITGEGQPFVREGAPIGPDVIDAGIEASLRRLKTDYIDLYQFHWPNRGSYMFRKNWHFDPSGQNRNETIADMEQCLVTLQKHVDKGNIRHFGLSNESAWGTAQWLRLSEQNGWPRVASIQNEYSLLCRLADTDLAELMVNEDVGFLPFSPLGAGLLTGKYQNGAIPDASRMTLSDNLGGRKSDRVFEAVAAYLNVAKTFGLDPVHMAMAWSVQRPFVCSSIFGATTTPQLEHILAGKNLTLDAEVLTAIDAAHMKHPLPF